VTRASAPAVQVQVGRDPAARAAVAALLAAGAASIASWALSVAGASPAAAGLVALVGATAAAAAGWRRPAAAGQLRWDGRAWSLLPAGSSSPEEGGVRVMIDLDAWMLLRFDGAGRARWLPLSRAAHRAQWHGLRCALFAGHAAADPSRHVAGA
jgi:hypothetical protein